MITEQRQRHIRQLLETRGLSFQPLQDEMVDHICCDVEQRMELGLSFEEALSQTMDEIPGEQFVVIQTDTMDAINHRVSASRWLSYSSIVLLFGSVVFKMFHLQFGEALIFAAFILIAMSLLYSTMSGVLINKARKGVLHVLAVIFGVVVMIAGYLFKILRLQGSDALIVISVAILIVAIFLNTMFVYKNASGRSSLLTFLHEKYTPGIERFLLMLLMPMVVYKIFTVMKSSDQFIGNLILLIVILGGVLQMIALGWRAIQDNAALRNSTVRFTLLASSTIVMLVFTGTIIPFEIRVAMVVVYLTMSAWFAFQIDESKSNMSLISMCSVPILFLGWGLIELKLINSDAGKILFNIPILVLLVAALFISKKESPVRTYLIIALSSYLFEYIY